jgi:hypothetical protein
VGGSIAQLRQLDRDSGPPEAPWSVEPFIGFAPIGATFRFRGSIRMSAATHRSPKTTDELVANSHHILYGIQMFAGTARLISRAPNSSDGLDEDERVQVLACIESHLTNARALMRFLYPTSGARGTDMLAADYLDGAPPLPPPWDRFADDLKQVDQELAHLTYERSSDVVRWEFGSALSAALRAFIESVPEDRVLMDFKTLAFTALANQSSRARLTVAPRTP